MLLAKKLRMYLIIFGAGPVSTFLISTALNEGHEVALIEPDEQLARQALDQYDILVLQSTIGDSDILQEAGAERADALLATTDDDATNLMAMFLGVEQDIGTLISIVNVHSHKGLFERLGVQILLDPEAIIANHLYKLLLNRRFEETVNLPGGETLLETTIEEDSRLIGKTLTQVCRKHLSEEMQIVALKRGDDHLDISDKQRDIELEIGDRLLLFSRTPLNESHTAPFSQRA
jgi:trk system potassium uptake protein TrkA